jgi:2-polyprenyl-3-methyl-5-hydroxy-6-metoxy-1,4-benzoquinol methylase
MFRVKIKVKYYAYMTSFDTYEKNLEKRLAEIRQGDRAYELNGDAIVETLPYESADSVETEKVRILDVGCGLGFVALKMANWPDAEVVGIDPSKKAIELAKREHEGVHNLSFYAYSAQEFASSISETNEPLFNRAVLNMVLHSVGDAEVTAILESLKKVLVPYGSLSIVVPDEVWLVQKLVEKAHAAGMSWEEMDKWGRSLMEQESVDLSVSIHGEDVYEDSITIYNRTLKDYGRLLTGAGYGMNMTASSPYTPENKTTIPIPYWEFSDHAVGADLRARDRRILLTQVRLLNPADVNV